MLASQAFAVPLEVVERGGALCWEDVLQLEVNTPFPRTEPPVRFLLRQPAARDVHEQGSELILTIRHDVMDGKSMSILMTHVLDAYVHITEGRHPPELPPVPVPPPVENLLPPWYVGRYGDPVWSE
jgi:hypothetical protein